MESIASSVPKEKARLGKPLACIVTTEYTRKGEGKWEEWRNVKWEPWQKAEISALDQTLVYGHGLFEGINFDKKKGGVLFLEEHLDRFYKGIELAHLEMPISRDELRRLIFETIERSGIVEGYVRPILTAGVGKNGTLGIGTKREKPSVFIYVCHPIALFGEEKYLNGARVTVSPYGQPGKNVLPFKHTVKWTDYFVNIMVKEEAKARGYDDGIMVNERDGKQYVSELSAANMFYIKDGVLYTPSLESNCLAGVTRNAVFEIAKKRNMTVREQDCTIEDFKNSDEAFSTGTAARLLPIAEIDGVKIGNGKEGEMTHEFRVEYDGKVILLNSTWLPDVARKFEDLNLADCHDLSVFKNEFKKAMMERAKEAAKEARAD